MLRQCASVSSLDSDSVSSCLDSVSSRLDSRVGLRARRDPSCPRLRRAVDDIKRTRRASVRADGRRGAADGRRARDSARPGVRRRRHEPGLSGGPRADVRLCQLLGVATQKGATTTTADAHRQTAGDEHRDHESGDDDGEHDRARQAGRGRRDVRRQRRVCRVCNLQRRRRGVQIDGAAGQRQRAAGRRLARARGVERDDVCRVSAAAARPEHVQLEAYTWPPICCRHSPQRYMVVWLTFHALQKAYGAAVTLRLSCVMAPRRQPHAELVRHALSAMAPPAG
jgi:hypothetical protein